MTADTDTMPALPEPTTAAQALEALRDALPRVGEPENVWCSVNGSDIRSVVQHIESTAAEIARLQAECEAMRHIGWQFSNVAFNWSQDPGRALTQADCDMLKDLQRKWEAVPFTSTAPSGAEE